MRFLVILFFASLAIPAHAQGRAAVNGLTNTARQLCDWSGNVADPNGLAAELDGRLGDAIGLRNGNSIIGTVYASDPTAGAQIWASNMASMSGGCDKLTDILDNPAAQALSHLQ